MSEETKNYNLQLINYQIDDILFVINQKFNWPKGGVTINPSFKRRIIEKDENSAIVSITIDIAKDESQPFSLHLTVNGYFKLDNWKETKDGQFLMKNNTSAILFPYLRQAVSGITSMSGLPPYVLPVMNVARLFEE